MFSIFQNVQFVMRVVDKVVHRHLGLEPLFLYFRDLYIEKFEFHLIASILTVEIRECVKTVVFGK